MPRIRRSEGAFASDLIEALGEVADHVDGRTELTVHRPSVGPPLGLPSSEVTEARRRLDMSQQEFARFLDVPLGTVRKWERGENRPSGAAQVLLRVIRREPDAVRRALTPEAG